jgi:DNA recombination protein RmuC
MTTAIIVVFAALVFLLVGYGFRSLTAKNEAGQAAKLVEQAVAEREAARNELAGVRQELGRTQAALTEQAGFARLAAERQTALEQLTAERNAVRGEQQAAAEQHRGELKRSNELAQQQAAAISKLEAELKAERAALQEKIALLDSAKKSLSDQFQALAAEILEQKSKSFSEGSQKELGTLLDPLKTQIADFKKKVEEAQTDSKTGVAELRGMIGNLSSLNQQISEDARNLTTALKGSSKAQGDWGEFILRDLLEKAGLHEGEQFSFQQSFSGVKNEEGGTPHTARTDVIVNMPGGRSLVIDSKVSLNAYTDAVNAATEEERRAALKQHVTSLRKHIAELAKAGYDRLPGVETPDFVVMFVPVEPAFLLALEADGNLWAEAYAEGILLVGPTTLLYVIRIVNVLWRQEAQAKNVREVMERGAALYEKFNGFVADLEAVGKGLRAADGSYTQAMKKLVEGPGNLVRQVEMLRQLGVKPRKPLPQSLLDTAGVDEEPGLELAAENDEQGIPS